MDDFIQIGYTKKTHGVAGEIKVVVEEHYEDVFLEKDRVFLEIRGKKQPFFIESVRGAGDLIVKFEDIKTREDALLLQSKGVFLPVAEVPEDLEPEEPETTYSGITDYLLVDETVGEIGRIEAVIDMPQQEMAVIHYQGREVLVPLNEQFIRSVDHKGKKVSADLPEGLLDL